MSPAVENHQPSGSAAGRRDLAHEGDHAAVQLPRTTMSTEEIDDTITRPGSVRINVKGAFIVDPDTRTPAPGAAQGNGRGSPTHPETSDIRLPYHTAVVSHIAVDVRILL